MWKQRVGCTESLKNSYKWRLIIKWTSRKYHANAWTGFIVGTGNVAVSCEHGSDTWGVDKVRRRPRKWLQFCQLLERNSASSNLLPGKERKVTGQSMDHCYNENDETHPAANEENWTGSTELILVTRTFVTTHCYVNRKHTWVRSSTPVFLNLCETAAR